MNTIKKEVSLGPNLFAMRGVTIIKGAGAVLTDDTGKDYIDCIGGHGAINVGHCNPRVVAAIKAQAEELIMSSPILNSEVRASLYEKLAAITPKSVNRTFLCNSGTEAVEAALKFARGATGKKGIVAFKNGFSGRTMGALSATWSPKYREPFEPLIPGFTHVSYGDIDALKQAVTKDTAAVLVEPIQGEGGVRLPPEGYLTEVGELCKEKDVLLVVDEIQTGFGRTGKLFACMHDDLQPDILCLAKSIAGGVPMGATVYSEAIADKLKPGWHGGTFGGNPLACAAANATIDYILEENLVDKAAKDGDYFLGKLKAFEDLKSVREVRGRGLMLAVECKQKVGKHISALMEAGVLALPAGPTVLRFLPPLVISRAQIGAVVEKTAAVLE